MDWLLDNVVGDIPAIDELDRKCKSNNGKSGELREGINISWD